MKKFALSVVCLAAGVVITFGAMEFLANDMLSQTMGYSSADRMDLSSLIQNVNCEPKTDKVIAIYEVID